MVNGFIKCLEDINFYKDEDTGAHSMRVSKMAYLIAQKLNLPEKFCEEIKSFTPLHDLGKVGIPDAILLKNGKLTKEEFEVIKTHVELGYNLIKKANFGIIAENITRFHHERFNGKGYLMGLNGDRIPIEARIVALADVYDALRQKRCYKISISHEESVKIITNESGKYFDPKIVNIFKKHQQIFNDIFNN